jgi:hypothetical protein
VRITSRSIHVVRVFETHVGRRDTTIRKLKVTAQLEAIPPWSLGGDGWICDQASWGLNTAITGTNISHAPTRQMALLLAVLVTVIKRACGTRVA